MSYRLHLFGSFFAGFPFGISKKGTETYRRSIKEAAYDRVCGSSLEHEGKLYNAAAAISGGRILGLVPKKNLPNYSEFYELRHFCPGQETVRWIKIDGERVPFGMNLLFSCEDIPGLVLAAEICEDVWVPCPPSISHAMAGATVIANCSASDETTGRMLTAGA